MSFTLNIRNCRIIDGTQALVTATIGHLANQKPNPAEVVAGLQSLCKNRLTPVKGSLVTINKEPTRTTVQGVMSLSKHIMDFPGAEALQNQGFKSLSSNMFLDENESIWTVKEEGGHKVCVKSNTVDNPEELQDLLAQCSTPIAAGSDPGYFQAVASTQQQQVAPEAGTFVTFVSESTTKFGVVLASIFNSEDPASYTGSVSVLASDSDTAETIQDMQIVACSQVDWEEPADLESQASGNVGKSQKDQLVAYYRKVFGHNAAYLKEIEKRIRSHAFA